MINILFISETKYFFGEVFLKMVDIQIFCYRNAF